MPRKELIRLVKGFKKFRQKYYETENTSFKKLIDNGQSPQSLIIGCSDSRVDPAIISSASPGDIFVVRNVANLVPPFEHKGGLHGVSSAIEFAVVNLKVKNIIVIGHGQCGGIRALMTGLKNPDPSFILKWMSIVNEARDTVLEKFGGHDIETQCAMCELESIRVSLKNLRSFPFVKDAIETRGLNLVGTYFDIAEGKLLELDEDTGSFKSIEEVP